MYRTKLMFFYANEKNELLRFVFMLFVDADKLVLLIRAIRIHRLFYRSWFIV